MKKSQNKANGVGLALSLSRLTVAASVCIFSSSLALGITTNVVNFDNLSAGTLLSGTTYGGVFWELGNKCYQGNVGGWGVANSLTYPHSLPNDAFSLWGSTTNGISFSSPVNVLGAYFGGEGSTNGWTSGVRAR